MEQIFAFFIVITLCGRIEPADKFCAFRHGGNHGFNVVMVNIRSIAFGTDGTTASHRVPCDVKHDTVSIIFPVNDVDDTAQSGNRIKKIFYTFIKYVGTHAISAGTTRDLRVEGCEIGWIGGAIQHYAGTDPNYPEGRRGSVTRYGNGVEVYGCCDGYTVRNCYIYQVYDAAITHQITTNGKPYELKNILYSGNLVENCVYSIEYFLDENRGVDGSFIDGCEISDNILRFSGYGWGQQRHNVSTPAHIKGWSYTNTARNFVIKNNIFDRAAYRMIHTVALDSSSCPEMVGNVYVQHLGGTLGRYGENRIAEPDDVIFDDRAEKAVKDIFGDETAEVYAVN